MKSKTILIKINGRDYPAVIATGWVPADTANAVIRDCLDRLGVAETAFRVGCSVASLSRWARMGCPIGRFLKFVVIHQGIEK